MAIAQYRRAASIAGSGSKGYVGAALTSRIADGDGGRAGQCRWCNILNDDGATASSTVAAVIGSQVGTCYSFRIAATVRSNIREGDANAGIAGIRSCSSREYR